MDKKNWLIVVVSGVVIVAVVTVVWLWSRRWLAEPAEPFKMVPPDAMLVLNINDLPDFISHVSEESDLWLDLTKIEGLQKVDTLLAQMDTLLNIQQSFRQLLRNSPVLISMHPVGKNGLTLLGIVRIPGFIKEAALKNSLLGLNGSGEREGPRNYNGHKIYMIQASKGGLDLYFSMVQGILLVSPSRIVLESSIRQQLAATSILDQKGFRTVKSTAGENTWGNLYLCPDKLPSWLKDWLSKDMAGTWNKAFPLAGWSEMDVNLKKESLLLNGFSSLNNENASLINVFRETVPGEIDLYRVYPSSTYAGGIFYLNNWERYSENLRLIRDKEQSLAMKKVLDTYKENCDCDLEKEFSGILGAQAGVAYLNISNLAPEKGKLIVLQLKSHNMALSTLEKTLKAFASHEGQPYSSFTRKISIDTETSYTIYTFPFHGLFEALYGSFFGEMKAPRFILYDNYMVIGESDVVLTRFLRDNILKHTLGTDPDFKVFTEGLSSHANFFFFVHLPHAEKLMNTYFNALFMKRYQGYLDKQMKVNYLGYQAIAQNHLVYNNIYFLYREEFEKEASTVWASLLDTTIHYKPQLFTNHYTGEKEIFLQDLKNQLYLLHKSGRVLWKIKIPEKIEGQAYQIDYYKNGKLQILFNTRHFLYLIDRNGNNVEHFPINLRSPATNGISLFDYEKNRDYRIFVGGADRRVYLYNKEGNLIPGWQMKVYESSINTPIHHYSIHGKDYIVFSDTMNVYILDRRGNVRARVREHIKKPPHQHIVLDDFSSQAPSILVNATEGNVFRIYFNGKVSSYKFTGPTENTFFDYADLDGDGTGEYIFVYENKLEVYQTPGEKYYSYVFDNRIKDPPILFTFSIRDKKLGVTDVNSEKIYLINNNGSLYNGFPLKGQSLFTIGKFESRGTRFNLVVGGEDNFIYNYIVK